MSKEYDYYDVICLSCGNKGELSMWSDDWFRWGYKWNGFEGTVRPTGPDEVNQIRCLKCGKPDAIVSVRRAD
jgi:hypothetical protein